MKTIYLVMQSTPGPDGVPARVKPIDGFGSYKRAWLRVMYANAHESLNATGIRHWVEPCRISLERADA